MNGLMIALSNSSVYAFDTETEKEAKTLLANMASGVDGKAFLGRAAELGVT